MTTKGSDFNVLSTRQILFVRYFTTVLVDLTVLNLFDEYWDKVRISSFTISLLAAVVLQIMLQITMRIEHGVGSHLKKKGRKGLRIFSAWALLFGSKFAILWILEILFSDKIQFLGAYNGIVTFIIVIATMLTAEIFLRWFTRTVLAKD